MSEELKEDHYAKQYAEYTTNQLKQEYTDVISIPNARTNIGALTRMSALIVEYEKRGLPMPGNSSRQSNHQRQGRGQHTQENGGVNVVSLLLGIVLIIVGIALSMNTGSVFYGAVVVGLFMVIKSFI